MAAPRNLWRVKSNCPRARTKRSSVPSFINVKTPLFSSEGDQSRSFEGLLWGRPRITSWLGLGPDRGRSCPKRRAARRSLPKPTGQRKHVRGVIPPQTSPKSRSIMHSHYCSPHSKHIKRRKAHNILAKAVTTTLNAPQLLSWPH